MADEPHDHQLPGGQPRLDDHGRKHLGSTLRTFFDLPDVTLPVTPTREDPLPAPRLLETRQGADGHTDLILETYAKTFNRQGMLFKSRLLVGYQGDLDAIPVETIGRWATLKPVHYPHLQAQMEAWIGDQNRPRDILSWILSEAGHLAACFLKEDWLFQPREHTHHQRQVFQEHLLNILNAFYAGKALGWHKLPPPPPVTYHRVEILETRLEDRGLHDLSSSVLSPQAMASGAEILRRLREEDLHMARKIAARPVRPRTEEVVLPDIH